MARGFFISVEGADGSGKSTQVRLLADHLRAAGHDLIVTREPGGGGEGAAAIRDLLLNGPVERWSALSEALMMYAARAEHLEKLIRPGLAAGKTVLTDRFADSTMAYQGIAGGVGQARVKLLHDAVVAGDDPDLTLILDVSADIGLQRATSRRGGESRFEEKGAAYQERVRAGFLAIARANPERCRLIDTSGDIDSVHRAIARAVDDALQSRR
ncbi:MAG: dTMP kinase [Parvularculaceae bacterium]|nr:dTMP kinase [Parvularculaceae bacterium]